MFELPALPYPQDALAPYISAETMATHHGKHHKKYIDTLNTLIENTPYKGKSLNDVILATNGSDSGTDKKIFNNAAQSWNHAFFWHSMTPDASRSDDNPMVAAIDRDFGDFDAFKKAFVDEGMAHFGSGWVWLVVSRESKMEIMSTHDADLPLAHGKKALLTCDLWEHAYYLDYKNDREKYLNTFVDQLANWEFAWSNLNSAPQTEPQTTK